MISESIQFLAGIQWICFVFFVYPTGSNKSKSDCARLLLKISFWQRYCPVLLKAYGHADDGKGWVFRMKWSRSPSENWLYFFLFLFFFFPFLSCSPRFQSPSPTSLLLPKIIASLCYSVSTLPGCSYHSALPLSPPSKCFNGDAAWCRHLSLCLSLSVPRSVPLEERHLLHYFFPQTIHVGGLENKTEGWEDPGEYRG